MFSNSLTRISFLLQVILPLQIALLGLRVRVRETAYHMLTAYQFRTGLALAFDKSDPDFKAAVAEAVEEATGGLKAKRDELLAENRRLKQGKEIDPAEVTRLETEVEKLQKEVADQGKALKAANKAAEDAAKALTSEQAFTQRMVVENALVAELTAAGVPPGPLLKGALALLRQEQIEVTVDGENRTAVVAGKPLGEFVKAWATGEDGKTYVAAAGNAGGGATGGKTDAGGPPNPWATATFNLSEQSKLYNQNPAQATALAAAAGVTL